MLLFRQDLGDALLDSELGSRGLCLRDRRRLSSGEYTLRYCLWLTFFQDWIRWVYPIRTHDLEFKVYVSKCVVGGGSDKERVNHLELNTRRISQLLSSRPTSVSQKPLFLLFL